jgi:recombinational DNA repair protein RecT
MENASRNIEEKIGEGLVRVGAMDQLNVDEVLQRQQKGDNRLFGEIALDLGYVEVSSLINYLKTMEE